MMDIVEFYLVCKHFPCLATILVINKSLCFKQTEISFFALN